MLLMLPLSAVQASPIYYDAVFNVDSVHGSAPADWGNVIVGTSLQLQFTWDPAVAIRETDTAFSHGPLIIYVMNVGDATIHNSFATIADRSVGSTSLFVLDMQPVVCTPPDPCAGGFGDWFVDDIAFNFGCADWSASPQLLGNLDCSSGATGSTAFDLFFTQQHDFGIAASLSGLSRASVPEPGGLLLFALGLAGMWFMSRKPRLARDHFGLRNLRT